MARGSSSDALARVLALIALVIAGTGLIWQIRSVLIQKAQFHASLDPEIQLWAGQSPNPEFANSAVVKNTGAVDLRDVRDLCRVIHDP